MELTPLKLHPAYKEYLWGGHRLRTAYHKEDAPEITAESWELAQRPEGASVVEGGTLAGRTLDDLAALDREAFWGKNCADMREFPLLAKLIDARKDLSIQVHPSDETALRDRGEAGKAEMWYIVDCDENAGIYFGFAREITAEEFRRRAEDGTICEVLNRVPVKKGDAFLSCPAPSTPSAPVSSSPRSSRTPTPPFVSTITGAAAPTGSRGPCIWTAPRRCCTIRRWRRGPASH